MQVLSRAPGTPVHGMAQGHVLSTSYDALYTQLLLSTLFYFFKNFFMWTILKVLLYIVSVLCLFLFFWP